MRRSATRLVIALLLALSVPGAADAGGHAVVVYDGSGTMRIRFSGPFHTPYGYRGPGSRYPFWWWGYEAPGPWQEGGSDEMDPALNAPRPPVHRYAHLGTLDGGYYDFFYLTGRTRLYSPYARAWANPVWRPWWFQPGTFHGPVIRGRTLKVDPATLGTQVPAGPAFRVVEPLPFQPTMVRLLAAGEYEAVLDMWRRARSGGAVEASGDPAYPGAAPDLAPVAVEEVWWADDRLRAVALVGAGRLEEAATAIGDAYLAEPRLAGLPLSGEALAKDRAALRRLVLRAIDYAGRHPSSDAWLLAAVMTQAEGRDEVAARFASRAEAQGLDATVARALFDALGSRPAPGR